jgi:hypothetical protein
MNPSNTDDTDLLMWLAIGLACLVALVVVYETIRRYRQGRRTGRSGSRAGVGFFKRISLSFQSLNAEVSRRERLAARERQNRNR